MNARPLKVIVESGSTIGLLSFWCAALILWSPLVTNAQIDPGTIQRINNNLANDAVSAVEVFSAANTVAAGTFSYGNPGPDDVEFSTFKLPLERTLGGETNQLRPFLQCYLGYFDLKQDVNGFGPPTGEIQIRSVTTTAGGGLEWRLNDWLSVSPRMLVAYSYAWQHFDRATAPGDPAAGLLPDWNVGALTLLPSLDVNAGWTFGRWDLGLNSRYTYLRVWGLHDNSDLIDLNSESHVWQNEVSASY